MYPLSDSQQFLYFVLISTSPVITETRGSPGPSADPPALLADPPAPYVEPPAPSSLQPGLSAPPAPSAQPDTSADGPSVTRKDVWVFSPLSY